LKERKEKLEKDKNSDKPKKVTIQGRESGRNDKDDAQPNFNIGQLNLINTNQTQLKKFSSCP
jgi:hypothetical protein